MKNYNQEKVINKDQEFQVIVHAKNSVQQKKTEISRFEKFEKIVKKITHIIFLYPLSAFFWIASTGAIVFFITSLVLFLFGIQIESRESLVVAIIIGVCTYYFLKDDGL